jgi:CBS domain-containing protein
MVSVRPDTTLIETMKVMTSSYVGSILVVELDGTLVGILTERDVLRFCSESTADLSGTKVQSLMTTDLIVAIPEDEVEVMINTMVENHFRHLPVFDKGRLIGIVSMGDLVKSQLHDAKVENRYLKKYIAGEYPA